MDYELQKVILNNATVYNILFESNILGHVVLIDNCNILIQNSEIDIKTLAESFGFEGHFLISENEKYNPVTLTSDEFLKPNYSFKVLNLNEYFLNELKL
jgi:hypothetical protein